LFATDLVLKASFEDNRMVSDISYVKGNSNDSTIFNEIIDYSLIPNYPYLKKADCFNANPLYIKKIEALNDKKSSGN